MKIDDAIKKLQELHDKGYGEYSLAIVFPEEYIEDYSGNTCIPEQWNEPIIGHNTSTVIDDSSKYIELHID